MSIAYHGDGESFPALPTRNTAVQRINQFLRKMDMKTVEAYLLSLARPGADPGVFVCEASFEDWTRYVKSEQHALVSRAMAWKNDKIYIVEWPRGIHEGFSDYLKLAVISATGTGKVHLRPHGSSYVDNLEPIEPDCSFGPVPGIGATRPNGLSWLEYHTLTVEVGVSRSWRQLDARAVQWSQFPGVEYILLIRLSPDLEVHQYKLYSVSNGALVQPTMPPTTIDNPANIVLDSRRFLGLPVNAPFPANFTAPNLTFDLFPLVQDILFDVHG